MASQSAARPRPGAYLEEESGGFAVVFLGSDVQGRKSNFSAGVVLQEDGHHFIVSLLQGDGQRSESVLFGAKKKTVVVKQSYGRLPALLSHLRRQTLVGSVGQQEADHGVVILLGRHVQRRESVLRLDVDGSAILHQDLDHLFLAGCGRQAKR